MAIASDSFRTVTVKIHDISQQLPYIVVNQADDNGKIIRFVPLDQGQKVTGFTGARLYYPPRSGDPYGDYVTGVESDGAWDFTIPVGVLSVGRVGCNLSFIDGDGETYSRNVVFLVEPAVSGVFDPEDGQQTRIDKIIGTVQDTADTAIESINQTADNAVESINKTASDAVESIGKAEESISESVTEARGSADAAANSEKQAAASASAAQTSEHNASNSATQASQSATAAKQSEDNAAESERNAASSAEQAANVVASVSGSVSQAENAARSASQSATDAAGSASAAGGSAQAAADSASKAGESATAAKASETNAASSASTAKISETNAADSATAAREAVDGFGLEVGTTTTGEPGTDAAVEIQKQGTKYVADFTIPRGEKGDPGSGGGTGIASVVTDSTLTGDGTSANKLGIADAMIPTKAQSITDSSLTKWNGGGYYKVPNAVYSDAPEKYSTVSISGIKIELNGIGVNNGVSNISILIITGVHGAKPAEELYINLSGYGHDSKKWYAIPNENTIEDALPAGSIPNDGTKFQQSVNDTPDTPTDILKLAGGYWNLNGYFTNLPSVYDSATKYYGTMLYVASNSGVSYRFLTIIKGNWAEFPRFFIYMTGRGNNRWMEVAFQSDLANYVPLSTYQALEARVQALEAKLANQ